MDLPIIPRNGLLNLNGVWGGYPSLLIAHTLITLTNAKHTLKMHQNPLAGTMPKSRKSSPQVKFNEKVTGRIVELINFLIHTDEQYLALALLMLDAYHHSGVDGLNQMIPMMTPYLLEIFKDCLISVGSQVGTMATLAPKAACLESKAASLESKAASLELKAVALRPDFKFRIPGWCEKLSMFLPTIFPSLGSMSKKAQEEATFLLGIADATSLEEFEESVRSCTSPEIIKLFLPHFAPKAPKWGMGAPTPEWPTGAHIRYFEGWEDLFSVTLRSLPNKTAGVVNLLDELNNKINLQEFEIRLRTIRSPGVVEAFSEFFLPSETLGGDRKRVHGAVNGIRHLDKVTVNANGSVTIVTMEGIMVVLQPRDCGSVVAGYSNKCLLRALTGTGKGAEDQAKSLMDEYGGNHNGFMNAMTAIKIAGDKRFPCCVVDTTKEVGYEYRPGGASPEKTVYVLYVGGHFQRGIVKSVSPSVESSV